MRCVVIGDIGWKHLYHLGDEAMTEAAIEQLKKRGATHITLIAGDPSVAQEFYDTQAIPRFGFTASMTDDDCKQKLKHISDSLHASQSNEHPILTSIRDADLAVIAGGGNLNSDFSHHIYERLAFARVAEHFKIPLVVAGQTVGPHLQQHHATLIEEILTISAAFGAREQTTFTFLQDLAPGHEHKVALTLDDAILLEGNTAPDFTPASLGLTDRYIVASFTSHKGTADLSLNEYQEKITHLLDELATKLNADIALVPHTGSFEHEHVNGDRKSNRRIAALSETKRLKDLRMLTAQETVRLTQDAVLSISTRYHPTIFGTKTLTPTVGISLSHYSTIRMRGSLANVGLGQFVIPELCWDRALVICLEAVKDQKRITHHLASVIPPAIEYQTQWWDAIVGFVQNSTENVTNPSYTPPQQIDFSSEAIAYCQTVSSFTAVLDEERIQLLQKKKTLHSHQEQIRTLRKHLDTALRRADQSENRKIVKLTDKVIGFFRR